VHFPNTKYLKFGQNYKFHKRQSRSVSGYQSTTSVDVIFVIGKDTAQVHRNDNEYEYARQGV